VNGWRGRTRRLARSIGDHWEIQRLCHWAEAVEIDEQELFYRKVSRLRPPGKASATAPISGDAVETIPEFVQENRGMRFSLLDLDFDVMSQRQPR
jgi:hypothetical protein